VLKCRKEAIQTIDVVIIITTFSIPDAFGDASYLIDKNDTSNWRFYYYRPVSNLNTISKSLERLLLSRIQPHVLASNFNPFQSAYSLKHATETGLLFVLDNIFHASDTGMSTLQVSLDLSAAFDTIDHGILLNRLRTSFGFAGSFYQWIESYLIGRNQFVRIGMCSA
jgi:hypothetical protein